MIKFICMLILVLFFLQYSKADLVQVTPQNPLQDYDSWNDRDEIWFAQSCPLTGSNIRLGTEMRNGILAAFHEINSIGGVWGRKKLKLLSLDDNYDPVSTLQNTNYFLYNITPPNTSLNYANVFSNGNYQGVNVNDVKVFGLLGYVGTPTVQAVYPDIVTKNVPLLASFTGVGWLRNSPFYSNVINLRASYDDETAAMVDYLINEKLIRRISVFYQNDSFGLAGLSGVQRTLVNYLNIPIRSTSSYVRGTLNVESAFQEIGSGKPAAIICIGTYAPIAKFIKLVKDLAFNSTANQYGYEKPSEIIFLTLSFVSSSALMEKLNSFSLPSNTFGSSYYTDNVVITQVVPSPFNLSIPVVRSYQNARRSYLLANDPSSYSSFTPSFIELEGYMAGRLVFSIFQKMVGNLTRSNFIATNYFGGNRLGTDIGDSESTGDSSGGVSLVDGIKVGPYRWCQSVNVMDLQLPYANQISLNVTSVSNTTCSDFNCNQGLKVVYKSSAQISNSQISFSIIGKSLSWYDYKGGIYCISDPSIVAKPLIFGQSIYSNKDYTEELMLRKGILLAFALYNQGLSSSDSKLELLTLYHSNTDELLSNTKEFIETHDSLALVGYSTDHFSLVQKSGKINIASSSQFANISLIGSASSINSLKLRNPFTKNVIHAHSSIFEQLGTIVEYSINQKASSRFSIIYSKRDEDSYATLGLLNQILNALGLVLDSSACIDGSNSYSYASIDSIFESLKANNSNPQVVIFAFPSNVDVVSSLIDGFQNTYLNSPKFGRNLNIFMLNSFFSLNAEYETKAWLTQNYKNFFQVSFVSHLDSVYSSSQLSISKFIQTMKSFYPSDYANSTLYHNKVLEGFYIGNLITSVLDNIDTNLNSKQVMKTIYEVKSFISQQTTYGSFSENSCNVGVRQNYVFTFASNSFSKVYTKSYDSGCALLSESTSTSIVSYIHTPLLFGLLIPYTTSGNSQIERQLDLLSQISDMDTSGHTQFSKGLSTYFRYITDKFNNGYSSKNVDLVIEYYSPTDANFNLPKKVNSLIYQNRVAAIIGSEFIFSSSDVSYEFNRIKSILESSRIPWINSYGGSMELRDPYTPYFVNVGPSVVDQTITFFDYFKTNGTIDLGLIYQDDTFYTNKAVSGIIEYCKTESIPIRFTNGISNSSIQTQVLSLFSNLRIERDLAIMVLANDSNSASIIKHALLSAQQLGITNKIYFGILIENSGKAFEQTLLSTSDLSNWISSISGSTLSSLSQSISNGVSNGKLIIASSMSSPFYTFSSSDENSFVQTFKTDVSSNFDSNIDHFTLEGYSIGYLIDIIVTSIEQTKSISGESSNITSSDLLNSIYSNTAFDLKLKKFGPVGYACSNSTTTSSTTCETSTSLGCSCNEGAKQVVLSTLASQPTVNTSSSFRYSNTQTINSFGTCGMVATVPSLSTVAIVMIVLAGVVLLLLITIVPILSYRYYAAKKAIKNAPKSKNGKLACCFTDIQNSTVLWQSNEKAMREALVIHNQIMRKNLELCNGFEVKTQGDSFFVVFKNPTDALDWCVSVQHDLLTAKWPADLLGLWDCRPEWDNATKDIIWSGVRVRMGLHYGAAEYVFDKVVKRPDYFGTCVNTSARVESVACGGQILVSEDFLLETWKTNKCRLYNFIKFLQGNNNSYVSEIMTGLTLQEEMNDKDLVSVGGSSAKSELSRNSISSRNSSVSSASQEYNLSDPTQVTKRKRARHARGWRYLAEDMGEFTLKGLEGTTRLFQIKSTIMAKRNYPAMKSVTIDSSSKPLLLSQQSAAAFAVHNQHSNNSLTQDSKAVRTLMARTNTQSFKTVPDQQIYQTYQDKDTETKGPQSAPPDLTNPEIATDFEVSRFKKNRIVPMITTEEPTEEQ